MRTRSGWARVSSSRSKIDTAYRHESGWLVRHCGHPTANWPYYLIDPEFPGDCVVTHNGLGFKRLEIAMDVVEALMSGALIATGDHCVRGTRRVVEAA